MFLLFVCTAAVCAAILTCRGITVVPALAARNLLRVLTLVHCRVEHLSNVFVFGAGSFTSELVRVRSVVTHKEVLAVSRVAMYGLQRRLQLCKQIKETFQQKLHFWTVNCKLGLNRDCE
jgi:hypothetical protein